MCKARKYLHLDSIKAKGIRLILAAALVIHSFQSAAAMLLTNPNIDISHGYIHVDLELSKQVISKVQERLAALGYEPGPADGIIGPRTTEAIKAYQDTEGISVTGTISEDLLQRLQIALPNLQQRLLAQELKQQDTFIHRLKGKNSDQRPFSYQIVGDDKAERARYSWNCFRSLAPPAIESESYGLRMENYKNDGFEPHPPPKMAECEILDFVLENTGPGTIYVYAK